MQDCKDQYIVANCTCKRLDSVQIEGGSDLYRHSAGFGTCCSPLFQGLRGQTLGHL